MPILAMAVAAAAAVVLKMEAAVSLTAKKTLEILMAIGQKKQKEKRTQWIEGTTEGTIERNSFATVPAKTLPRLPLLLLLLLVVATAMTTEKTTARVPKNLLF
eukprot:gnl/Spiro4/12300_TR6484_c0_g1_i1.p3 gnl/Spiro4/12300_TR6484_c0_g1~~gnl/Spiro4/12300_TR6484_c0_g1_i1.p3  ORF type:complete len:103 (+),score=36.28 gnl/Spiro4/12300_TR6484_c0_g1_i1:133-441(+)